MLRILLLVALCAALLAGAVNAVADTVAPPERGGEVAAAEPYREGPLARRASVPRDPPAMPAGVGEALAVLGLLGVGLGLRWADRAGGSAAPPAPMRRRVS